MCSPDSYHRDSAFYPAQKNFKRMKKIDRIELKPQTGLGPLKFGMKKEELIELMGEPDQIFRDPIADDDHTLMEWNALKLRLNHL